RPPGPGPPLSLPPFPPARDGGGREALGYPRPPAQKGFWTSYPRERLAAIGAISPDEFQTRLQWLEPDQQASCPCLVRGIRGRHLHRQQQPERVHQHMPFPPLDLFAAIIPFDATGFFCGFHTLAVHNRRRGVGVAARSQADGAAQRLVDLLPDAM